MGSDSTRSEQLAFNTDHLYLNVQVRSRRFFNAAFQERIVLQPAVYLEQNRVRRSQLEVDALSMGSGCHLGALVFP